MSEGENALRGLLCCVHASKPVGKQEWDGTWLRGRLVEFVRPRARHSCDRGLARQSAHARAAHDTARMAWRKCVCLCTAADTTCHQIFRRSDDASPHLHTLGTGGQLQRLGNSQPFTNVR